MIKKVLKIFRKILVAIVFLYGYNLLATPIGYIVPINLITVMTISFFGIPALLAFIALMIFVF